MLVRWNEPYQKLATCDVTGIIFVWIKHDGRWSIELINDRSSQVIIVIGLLTRAVLSMPWGGDRGPYSEVPLCLERSIKWLHCAVFAVTLNNALDWTTGYRAIGTGVMTHFTS